MVDILTKLEKMRDDLTTNTPTTSTRRRKTSADTQPKIEIIRVEPTQPPTPPTNSPSNRAYPTNDVKRPSEARRPRRPAPKIPEEGSLKRRSTAAPMLISARPLEKRVEGVKAQHREDETQGIAGAGMLKSNPLFKEIERQEKEEERGRRKRENREGVEEDGEEVGRERVFAGVESEQDLKEGVLLLNPSVREETRMEGGGREGGVSRGGIEREEERQVERRGGEREEEEEEEEWKDDFFLEPPEDFSQSSIEVQDATGLLPPPDLVPSLPLNFTLSSPTLSSNLPPLTHSLPPLGETHYTSLDDYSIGSQDSTILDAAEEEEEGEEEGDGLYDRETSPPVSYHHSGRGLTWDEKATRINVGGALNGVKEQEELPARFPSEVEAHSLAHTHNTGAFRQDEEEEEDFDDDDDSMYRRPTSRIPGMKRIPSWGRSDRSGDPGGQDDLPQVVYGDDVAALIW